MSWRAPLLYYSLHSPGSQDQSLGSNPGHLEGPRCQFSGTNNRDLARILFGVSSSDKFWFSGNVTEGIITIWVGSGYDQKYCGHKTHQSPSATKKLQFYAIVILASLLNYNPQFKHVILQKDIWHFAGGYIRFVLESLVSQKNSWPSTEHCNCTFLRESDILRERRPIFF